MIIRDAVAEDASVLAAISGASMTSVWHEGDFISAMESDLAQQPKCPTCGRPCKLEEAGYVERCRDRDDERVLTVTVTEKGMELREKALSVPGEIASCIPLPVEDAITLARILRKMMADLCGEEQ